MNSLRTMLQMLRSIGLGIQPSFRDRREGFVLLSVQDGTIIHHRGAASRRIEIVVGETFSVEIEEAE